MKKKRIVALKKATPVEFAAEKQTKRIKVELWQ
jgi:hypothetical protein